MWGIKPHPCLHLLDWSLPSWKQERLSGEGHTLLPSHLCAPPRRAGATVETSTKNTNVPPRGKQLSGTGPMGLTLHHNADPHKGLPHDPFQLEVTEIQLRPPAALGFPVAGCRARLCAKPGTRALWAAAPFQGQPATPCPQLMARLSATALGHGKPGAWPRGWPALRRAGALAETSHQAEHRHGA